MQNFGRASTLCTMVYSSVSCFFSRGDGRGCAIMRLLVHLNFLHFAVKREPQCELSNSINDHLFDCMCHFCCNVYLQIEPQQ